MTNTQTKYILKLNEQIEEISIVKEINNLQWIEKYRPTNLNEIISHVDIIKALMKMIDNKNFPHLLLYGPSGTGKTSTIMACARRLYGDFYKNMILELNGSDDRGINVVREQIKDFAASKNVFSLLNKTIDDKTYIEFKIVILDEVDSMTTDAQFALRRMIENYTKNVRFCLICNNEIKIIDALKSRCQPIKFAPITNDLHIIKINEIIKNEKINIAEEAIKLIIEISNGDMRKSINILQSVYIIHNINKINYTITKNDIYHQIGYLTDEERETIYQSLYNKNLKLEEVILEIEKIKIEYNITTNEIMKDIIKSIATTTILNKYNVIITNLGKIKIYDRLGLIEIYLSKTHNEEIILGDIISIVRSNITFK